jgi:hypothetical protein
MNGLLILQCAWCLRLAARDGTYEEKSPGAVLAVTDAERKVSHGICPSCMERELGYAVAASVRRMKT